ncbi:MAG: heparan-alpha-glucosaminide N-acetyltransferase domain-containing protein [Candidatus Hodarchaeota archaeon]
MKKRFKSIDFLRGFYIFMMVLVHLCDWWLVFEANWFKDIVHIIIEPIGATGFLFISGVSAALSYKSNQLNLKDSNEINWKTIKNIYFFRAFLILLIALIYNIILIFRFGDISDIWNWNVLQAIAISLILVWPLLKTSKTVKIIVGIVLLLIDQLILAFLRNFKGVFNLYGILFHILYNPLDQFTIISFFTMFLFGSVVGDIVFDITLLDDKKERGIMVKNNFLIGTLILGSILVPFGVLFQFPAFFLRNTFPSFIYSIGVILVAFSLLISIEEFGIIKTKKNYNIMFFYSFYSFTVYLGHNLLYFLFFDQLDAVTFWIPIIITMSTLTLLLRTMYIKVGPKLSLKTGIAVLSFIIASKINRNKNY